MGKFRQDIKNFIYAVVVIICFLIVAWLMKPMIDKHPGESIVLGGCALVVTAVIRAAGGKNGKE